MQVFGVAGPGSGELVEDLVPQLSGRVAVVRDATPDGGALEDAAATTTYTRAGDHWQATGLDRSLPEVLDQLALDHDYTILVDVESAVPTVALGDTEPADTLLRSDGPDTVDPDEVIAEVSNLEPHVTLPALVEQVKRSPEGNRAGAIATFTGRVRAKDAPDDVPTEYLEFETYEDVAEDRMATIQAELEAREGVREVVLHHRTGVVEAGEDIVFVVVLAGHREEAFGAVSDGIDRLKAEVPIFKREVTAEETFWVHER